MELKIKPKTDEYWRKRIQSNEDYAQKIAKQYSKQQEKYYKQLYNKIAAELNKYYAAVADGTVTRTQLWNYARYSQMMDMITNNCSSLGSYQKGIMDEAMAKIFEETIGMTLEDFNKSNMFEQIDIDLLRMQSINANWSGEDYSQRIWNNTNELAARLKEDITSMIAIGKSSQEIKKQIQNDLNVSYNIADRLIRTETSYFYNTAALESYKKAGCTKIEILAEGDSCEICASVNGKKFDIGMAPTVPFHPNCRCCYLPVIE